jgi:hypothetical protein
MLPDPPRGRYREWSRAGSVVCTHRSAGREDPSFAEIGGKLDASVCTVESHRAHIQQKLRRSTRAELVRYALDHELLAGCRPVTPPRGRGQRRR